MFWILVSSRGKFKVQFKRKVNKQHHYTIKVSHKRPPICQTQRTTVSSPNLPSGTTEEGKQTFFPHPSKTITWGFGRKWVNSQWNLQILLLNPLGVLQCTLLCLILSLSLAHLACKSKNNEELSWKVTGKQRFPQNYEGNKTMPGFKQSPSLRTLDGKKRLCGI